TSRNIPALARFFPESKKMIYIVFKIDDFGKLENLPEVYASNAPIISGSKILPSGYIVLANRTLILGKEKFVLLAIGKRSTVRNASNRKQAWPDFSITLGQLLNPNWHS